MPPRSLRSRQRVPGQDVERISLSISAGDKAALDRIAEEKRVSLAWVVRDAVSHYLAASEEIQEPRKNNRA